MLRQYLEIKKQYPGTLLFFRLGDFYEMFNEDAIVGSKALDITLTARHKNSERPVPMCGVPHHAASNYIAKLIKKGFRVAICEQTEEASATKKLVKREVVRVISPGTAIDEQLLDNKEAVYLAAVFGTGEKFAIAYLDLSTGRFFATEFQGNDAWNKSVADIINSGTRELLYPPHLQPLIEANILGITESNSPSLFGSNATPNSPITITKLEEEQFDLHNTSELLKAQFGVMELKAFQIDDKKDVICAAGACLSYAQNTQRTQASHISEIEYLEATNSMILDPITLRNLDILESGGIEKSTKRTLLGVIDETVTGMGARMLRSWVLRPLLKRLEIETRLSAVTELLDSMMRDKIRYLLKEIYDIERLVGRLNLGTASPRDLISLSSSLAKTPQITDVLSEAESLLLQVLGENVHTLPELRQLIDSAIVDEPPANLNDGGIIRKGFNSELDELRDISRNAKKTIAGFEDNERERTGIQSLKVKFNNVFGYFIEISKSNLAKAPEEYERRQTLTNAERFTTPELKIWETKVLGAEERIVELENSLFKEVRATAAKHTKALQATARSLATLDALAGLAETAAFRNYNAPNLHDGDLIEIHSGRHPVVEAFSNELFVPNDLLMNNSTDRLLIITGANMGGKSTVLRQIALIQILAQIGSYVPAKMAKLPMVDRIWTRVGASDDLSSGRSTFMVEMTETATILHNASPRSLVLLDEIGRGTSTFDGLAIAWAVAEYLHNSSQHSAKTLFATHYHELTELADQLPGAKNYQIAAIEKSGEIIFLHKLEKGKASKSYGIAVARLAGLPIETIERAKQVLSKLEEYELAVFNESGNNIHEGADGGNEIRMPIVASPVSLFAVSNEEVIDELRNIETESLTAEAAKEALLRLKANII